MVRSALTAAVFLGCGLSIAPAGAGPGPLTLAPHRAVYDLSLADTSTGGSVASVSGRMVMEFTGSRCAGYTTKLRFVTETEDSDGKNQVTDSRASTFEAGDGRRLDFTNETYTDDTLAEESHGSASRKDQSIAVALSKPADKKFNLASGIVFPTEQMEKILDSARKGERFLSLDLYDGSEDGQTVFDTAGVIGPASSAEDDVGDETAVKAAGIAALRHWPVTISYFEQKDATDKPPFYVMHFVMYENGVGRSLKIDYGDFALDGRLTRLDMLPSQPCSVN
jgi:hypothetical protein